MTLPDAIRYTGAGQEVEKALQHSATSSRYLVYNHAKAFHLPNFRLVDEVPGVAAKLRLLYARS